MQIQVQNFALLANVLNQAKNIYIIVAKRADVDTLAAGLFLEENLSRQGKKVLLVSSGSVPEGLRYFASKISTNVPAKKLIVSFDWRKNQVEKVAYNLEGEKFNLVITPRGKNIDSESVSIYNSGDDPDLIVTLGIKKLLEIPGIDIETLENKTVVNIDKGTDNQNFASLNFVYQSADSLCAVVAQLAEKTNIAVLAKSCEILMIGMKSVTNNFEKVSDAATFEAAAFCTKIGGPDIKLETNNDTLQFPKDNNQTEKTFRAKQITN